MIHQRTRSIKKVLGTAINSIDLYLEKRLCVTSLSVAGLQPKNYEQYTLCIYMKPSQVGRESIEAQNSHTPIGQIKNSLASKCETHTSPPKIKKIWASACPSEETRQSTFNRRFVYTSSHYSLLNVKIFYKSYR